jgi:hypothetical protein
MFNSGDIIVENVNNEYVFYLITKITNYFINCKKLTKIYKYKLDENERLYKEVNFLNLLDIDNDDWKLLRNISSKRRFYIKNLHLFNLDKYDHYKSYIETI